MGPVAMQLTLIEMYMQAKSSNQSLQLESLFSQGYHFDHSDPSIYHPGQHRQLLLQ